MTPEEFEPKARQLIRQFNDWCVRSYGPFVRLHVQKIRECDYEIHIEAPDVLEAPKVIGLWLSKSGYPRWCTR